MSTENRERVLVDADWVEAHLDDPKVVLVEVDEDTAAYDKNHIQGRGPPGLEEGPAGPGPPRLREQGAVRGAAVREGHRQRRHRRAVRRQQQLVRVLRLLVLQALRPRRRQAARRRPQEVGARLPRAGRRRSTSARRRRTPRRTRTARSARSATRSRRPSARRTWSTSARPDEYSGRLLAPAHLPQEQSQRPGHIPTAANIPWSQAANDDGTFKSDDELTTLYADKGVDLDKDTIAYCRIGERSAHTWFVLHEILDQPNVKNYDGSWTEWGSLVGVPIELGDQP